jgi:YD repeat-containing protein
VGREDLNFARDDRYTDLILDSDARAIRDIEIVSPGLYKKFHLVQDYFISAPCTGCLQGTNYDAVQHRKRLRLSQLAETDAGGRSLPPYFFSYNYVSLPSRYSLARDQQGFYNGFDKNNGWFQNGMIERIGPYSFNVTTNDFHDPDEMYMQAGVLTSITHPLGRVTSFQYEAHRAPLKKIGGLRVRRIKEDDGNGNGIIRDFTYEEPHLYFDDSDYALYTNQNLVTNIINEDHRGAYQEFLSTSPVVPLTSSVGYAIAYNKVTETQTGNGSTVHTYYAFPPIFNSNTRTFPIKPITPQPGSGEEKTEEMRDKNNNLVSQKAYDKDAPEGDERTVTGRRVEAANFSDAPFIQGPIFDMGVPLDGFYYFEDYTIASNLFLTRAETVTQQNVTRVTQYSYPAGKVMPNVITTTASNGDAERTDIVYPDDAGSGAPPMMYDQADENYKHLVYNPVSMTRSLNGIAVEKSENFFEAQGSKLHLTRSRQYPTGTSEFRESQYQYDDLSNMVSIKTTDGVSRAFRWGYNSAYVIAEGLNCAPEEMYYEGFEETSANTSTVAKTGLKSYADVLSVNLPQPGTYVLSYWSKSGSEDWQHVQSTITASTIIGGHGTLIDEVRLYPARAKMTTRQFSPGLGVVSETDANSNSVYYEYDSFGRLKLQRDTDRNLVKVFEYQISRK